MRRFSRFDFLRWVPFAWLAAIAGFSAELRLEIREAGLPLPSRVHLRGPGQTSVRAPDLPFFRDHFACPGQAALDLAPGRYVYEIERGPEYTRAAGVIELGAGGTNLVIELLRLANLAAEGWWSGDLHVHRPAREIEGLMRAEDLHVAPVITWWNQQNPWKTNAVPAQPLVRFDTNRFYHLMAGEDEREGGALLYFNLERPLPIAGAGREYPSPMQFLNQALQNPGVHVDLEKPFWWDAPVWVASSNVHSIGLANNHMWRTGMLDNEAWGKPRDLGRFAGPRGNGLWTQEIYYHLLECGLRIPPSAGSASGVLPNPVGYNRVYVQVEGALDWSKWWHGLRSGRSFVSNGPLLRCAANGQAPGYVFRGRGAEPVRIEPRLVLTSRDPKGVIEIIKNGEVIRAIPFSSTNTALTLDPVEFRSPGWFLARAIAEVPNTFRFASTAPYYVEFEGRPNRVRGQSVEFFLEWVRERKQRVKGDDPAQRASVLAHHESAERFWRSLLSKASD